MSRTLLLSCVVFAGLAAPAAEVHAQVRLRTAFAPAYRPQPAVRPSAVHSPEELSVFVRARSEVLKRIAEQLFTRLDDLTSRFDDLLHRYDMEAVWSTPAGRGQYAARDRYDALVVATGADHKLVGGLTRNIKDLGMQVSLGREGDPDAVLARIDRLYGELVKEVERLKLLDRELATLERWCVSRRVPERRKPVSPRGAKR